MQRSKRQQRWMAGKVDQTNLGKQEETSPKICLNKAHFSSVTVWLNHSSSCLFIPPSIINLNFVMISLTFKVRILHKNEKTYIRMKAIRTYKKIPPPSPQGPGLQLVLDFHTFYTTPPNARFEVLTVTLLNIQVFWTVMPCWLCVCVCVCVYMCARIWEIYFILIWLERCNINICYLHCYFCIMNHEEINWCKFNYYQKFTQRAWSS